MNLLKRSPPPPLQQPPSHSVGLDINRTAGCSVGGMGGENSAFRAVVTGPAAMERVERIDDNARQTERKPSAFRMISQLVGDTSLSSPPSSNIGPDQRNVESGVESVPGPGPGRTDMESVDDEDEEIDVQDSDQDVPSPSPVVWRDHWTEQQPLELIKHDR